jgi:hypothetical protein
MLKSERNPSRPSLSLFIINCILSYILPYGFIIPCTTSICFHTFPALQQLMEFVPWHIPAALACFRSLEWTINLEDVVPKVEKWTILLPQSFGHADVVSY